MAKKRRKSNKSKRNTPKRRVADRRASYADVTRAQAEELRHRWENAPPEELRRLGVEERFRRMSLMMAWGRRFGWAPPPRTPEDYMRDPWVRLRKLCLEREGKK